MSDTIKQVDHDGVAMEIEFSAEDDAVTISTSESMFKVVVELIEQGNDFVAYSAKRIGTDSAGNEWPPTGISASGELDRNNELVHIDSAEVAIEAGMVYLSALVQDRRARQHRLQEAKDGLRSAFDLRD